MNAFKMSWNTEGGQLACRWVDSKQSGKCYALSIFDHLRVSDDPWNQSTRPFDLSGRTRTWPGCLIGHIFRSRRQLTKHLLWRVFIGLLCTAAVRGASQDQTPQSSPAGALIQMTSSSIVGVLLDEIPVGPLREAAAANAAGQVERFLDRAS
jgi:hypothetical protein